MSGKYYRGSASEPSSDHEASDDYWQITPSEGGDAAGDTPDPGRDEGNSAEDWIGLLFEPDD